MLITEEMIIIREPMPRLIITATAQATAAINYANGSLCGGTQLPELNQLY